MEIADQQKAAALAREALDAGDHFLQQLEMRTIPAEDGTLLTMELDNVPRRSNSRGALQGGLVATLIDVVAGRAAFELVDDGSGRGTATANMSVHYLSPVVAGPARATAKLIRQGRRNIVIQVDVSDVAEDRLAAIATVSFTILEARPSVL